MAIMYRSLRFYLLVCSILSIFVTYATAAQADEAGTRAKQIWQLLDYIAVDYRGAVAGGQVTAASEYSEMQDFALNAEKQLKELPPTASSRQMQDEAARLRQLVDAKADPVTVADQAHRLAADVLKSYPFPVAPVKAPDLLRGAQLFQAQCAACHGVGGRGDGPGCRQPDAKAHRAGRTYSRSRTLTVLLVSDHRSWCGRHRHAELCLTH
ncbi:c-type cytochrome [Cupriavidus basilensis]